MVVKDWFVDMLLHIISFVKYRKLGKVVKFVLIRHSWELKKILEI